MSTNRPKQPDRLRAQILAATRAVLLDDGPAAVTLDRVLARTDISKGGLQHHFRSKQLLLDALFDHLFGAFVALYEARLADEPPGPARHIRAYVKASSANSAETRLDGRAAVLLTLGDARYQARWAELMERVLAADTLDRGTLLACRLAADGLWYGLVCGPAPSDEDANAALQRILQLTDTRTP